MKTHLQINRPEPNEILATLKTNNFTIDPVGGVILASFAGFSTMMLVIMMSQSGILGMFGLLGGMAFVFLKKSGRAEYLLTRKGIYQNMTPFLDGALGFKPFLRFFSFPSIYSYQVQDDMDRSLQGYTKLTLSLSVSPGKVILTNKKNPEQFVKFKMEFLKLVEQKNETALPPFRTQPQTTKPAQPHIIKKKKSFYQTAFAKFLAIFFLAMTVVLLYLSFTGVLNFRNSFRLYLIIIPGTIFMFYKSFKKV